MNFPGALPAALMIALLLCPTLRAADRVPILLDTDIGSDVDDAFALALALASPEVDLQGVTTVAADAETRAWMVCRLLTAVGRRDVPSPGAATRSRPAPSRARSSTGGTPR